MMWRGLYYSLSCVLDCAKSLELGCNRGLEYRTLNFKGFLAYVPL